MEKSFDITKLDWYLISLVLGLIAIGMIVIYSAAAAMGSGDLTTFYKQLIWFGIGLLAAAVAFMIPSKIYFAFAYVFYGITLFVLAYVLLQGGIERWIRIGGFTLQPSEFAKITVVIVLARFLSQSKLSQNNWKDYIGIALLVSIPVYMVKEQPDLGTSMVYMSVVIPMLFWAGIQPFILFAIISPVISVIASSTGSYIVFLLWMLIVLAILYLSKKPLILLIALFLINISVGVMTPYLWNKLKPYQQNRILSVLDPQKDPKGTGYQVLQSLNAIGSGGPTGKGYMEGTQTQLRFLPEQHNDFIFSVLGEEFGFVGVSVALLLFFLLINRLFSIAASMKGEFEGLIVIGAASILLFHVSVNTGMTVGIMPVTGLPLPFLSSGGSFLISMMALMGLVVNLAYNKYRN